MIHCLKLIHCLKQALLVPPHSPHHSGPLSSSEDFGHIYYGISIYIHERK